MSEIRETKDVGSLMLKAYLCKAAPEGATGAVGKTSTAGKQVFMRTASHSAYRGFTKKDHAEAATIHSNLADDHYRMASRADNTGGNGESHEARANMHANIADAHRKLTKSESVEVGKTSSGKPIYGPDHSSYKKLNSVQHIDAPRVQGKANIKDAINSMIRAHGNYSAQDHADAGRFHYERSKKFNDASDRVSELHSMAAGFLRAGKRLAKATRYEGLSGNDIDHLARLHQEAKSIGENADRSQDSWDHRKAASVHMEAARAHKRYVPEARDRIHYHLTSARYHASAAGTKAPLSGYTKDAEHAREETAMYRDVRVKKSLVVADCENQESAGGYGSVLLSSYLEKAAKKPRIIGHTQSGKPVFNSEHVAYNKLRAGEDEHNAGIVARSVHYKNYTSADHHDAAEVHSSLSHSKGSRKHFDIAGAHYGASDPDNLKIEKANTRQRIASEAGHVLAAKDKRIGRKVKRIAGVRLEEEGMGKSVQAGRAPFYPGEATAEKLSRSANAHSKKALKTGLSADHFKAALAHERAEDAHAKFEHGDGYHEGLVESHRGEAESHHDLARQAKKSLAKSSGENEIIHANQLRRMAQGASAKAYGSESSEDHLAAHKAHKEAAKAFKKIGSVFRFSDHRDEAKAHADAAKRSGSIKKSEQSMIALAAYRSSLPGTWISGLDEYRANN